MLRTVVLFDLDETLIADQAATDAALCATAERARAAHGVEPSTLARAVCRHAGELWRAAPTIAYCQAIGISSSEGLWCRFAPHLAHFHEYSMLRALREWAPAYRRRAWSRALAELGADDAALAVELAEAYLVDRRAHHAVFPDTVPTLERLCRHGHRLGLVTNGVSDLQREKLRGAALEHYFHTVVVSGDIEAGKPDPVPFRLALSQLGVAPEGAAMVGDTRDRDVLGARRTGIRAIWLNRSGATLPNDADPLATPDAEIAGLDQLAALL